MTPRHIRLIALLAQALYCLAIFGAGIVTGIPFFCSFIGPALLLVTIAFFPRFLFDVIATATIIMMLMIALLFSAAAVVFNHNFLPALAAAAIPAACLAALVYAMERLKREEPSYA